MRLGRRNFCLTAQNGLVVRIRYFYLLVITLYPKCIDERCKIETLFAA